MDPERLRQRASIVVGHRVEMDAEGWHGVHDALTSGHGWYAGAVVADGAGRTVFVQNRWSDGWVLPGGSVEPEELLAAGAVREVREETGLVVTIEGVVACVEQAFVHGGERVTGHLVVFVARAETPALDDDPGIDDGEIASVRWFEEVPERIDGLPRRVLVRAVHDSNRDSISRS